MTPHSMSPDEARGNEVAPPRGETKCPPVGTRVRYVGPSWWAAGHDCIGTVRRIYRKYDDVVDDDTDEVVRGPLLPESRWSVAVELDHTPPEFPYGQNGGKTFAPSVAEIERLPEPPQ